jgi:hypothetical protein
MTDLTVNNYHLPTLVQLLRDAGSPTEGKLPAVAWQVSNILPWEYGHEFLTEAGYKPFQGYPLIKAGV